MYTKVDNIYGLLNGKVHLNRQAQKDFYADYFGYVMSITIRYANSYEDAVEMANDGYYKIFKEIDNFVIKPETLVSSFNAWIKKIIINASIDYLRKYYKNKSLSTITNKELDIKDASITGEDILQYKEILQCIEKLSFHNRVVFNLYVIDGYSHQEISNKLKIPVNTSKSYLFKAKNTLKEMLSKNKAFSYEKAV